MKKYTGFEKPLLLHAGNEDLEARLSEAFPK